MARPMLRSGGRLEKIEQLAALRNKIIIISVDHRVKHAMMRAPGA
jgi:hypothetical protein